MINHIILSDYGDFWQFEEEETILYLNLNNFIFLF